MYRSMILDEGTLPVAMQQLRLQLVHFGMFQIELFKPGARRPQAGARLVS